MKLIDKDKIVAEIERILKNINLNYVSAGSHSSDSDINKKLQDGISKNLQNLLSFLDTLDVKEADIWHLQEKEDIYDAVNDWRLQTFACVMKDGTIQKFIGNMDEDYEGHINIHIDGVNDDYDDVDDIVKWTVINDM